MKTKKPKNHAGNWFKAVFVAFSLIMSVISTGWLHFTEKVATQSAQATTSLSADAGQYSSMPMHPVTRSRSS